MRCSILVLALVGTLAVCHPSRAAGRGEIIPQTTALRHGLTRPWFSQVQLDLARARVTHMVLDSGTLFLQTDEATLHAMDAETGQTLWAAQVGRRDHPSLTPAANKDMVAVVNGSFLYVVNRHNGNLLRRTQLEGVAGAGPALSEHRVFVPMVSGIVLSFQLERVKDPLAELGRIQEKDEELAPEEAAAREEERRQGIRLVEEYPPPLACRSFGRALVQPIVTRQSETEQYVAWPTDRGFLFVGCLNENEKQFGLRYRLETEAGIAAKPTYLPPNPEVLADSGVIYAASRDGFVYAINENAGESLWRFSTADPILQPAVVIGARVYVVTRPGAMHCLDAKSGTERWSTYEVAQFMAQSKDRVYVADKLDRIVVLDAATGARLDRIPIPGQDHKLINMQTDRIYLATATGLVQCLHEVGLPEPIHHLVAPEAAPAEAPPAAEGKAAPEPKAQKQPGPAANPFAKPPK